MVGLIALLPQIVDAVNVPVIATGGIADARGVAAALILGASAVQIGTGFLRSPEAMVHPVYADEIAQTEAHETMITRAFTGRPGRAVTTRYARALCCTECPTTGSISYPTRTHSRDAGRCAEGRGRRQNATVGWSGRQIGTHGASRYHRSAIVGRFLPALVVIGAIETASVDHLVTLITSESAKGIRERFQKVTAAKKSSAEDVDAVRGM